MQVSNSISVCSPAESLRQDETPAEKKAREALDRTREKELAKTRAAAASAAMKIVAKAQPAIDVFRAMLVRDGISLVAEPLRKPIETALAVLEHAAAVAEVIASGQELDKMPELPDMKHVSDAISSGKRAVGLVTGILATIARSQMRG